MNFFTVRNLVILALVQIGVVTAGVLAAGVSVKWYTTFNAVGPIRELEFICDFGWLAFAPPIIWAMVALWQFRNEDDNENAKWAVLIVGWLLLATLIYGSVKWAVLPWFRTLGCGGLSN